MYSTCRDGADVTVLCQPGEVIVETYYAVTALSPESAPHFYFKTSLGNDFSSNTTFNLTEYKLVQGAAGFVCGIYGLQVLTSSHGCDMGEDREEVDFWNDCKRLQAFGFAFLNTVFSSVIENVTTTPDISTIALEAPEVQSATFDTLTFQAPVSYMWSYEKKTIQQWDWATSTSSSVVRTLTTKTSAESQLKKAASLEVKAHFEVKMFGSGGGVDATASGSLESTDTQTEETGTSSQLKRDTSRSYSHSSAVHITEKQQLQLTFPIGQINRISVSRHQQKLNLAWSGILRLGVVNDTGSVTFVSWPVSGVYEGVAVSSDVFKLETLQSVKNSANDNASVVLLGPSSAPMLGPSPAPVQGPSSSLG